MLNQPRPDNLPPDWRAVRFDETIYWNSTFLDEHRISKMHGVYLVDLSSVTYCCSLTPAYAMHFMGSVYEDAGHLSDSERETLFEEIMLADSGTDSVCYMDCKNVDRHIGNDNQTKIELDEDDWKGDPNDGLDYAHEFYQGNPTW